MEDIINRGDGVMIFRLYNATEENTLADTDVQVHKDGRSFYVGAGEDILVYPGESITIYPRCFHQFFIKEGTGDTLFSEISMCSDDKTDNYFLNNEKRFPIIDEDEPVHRLLCTEYPAAK